MPEPKLAVSVPGQTSALPFSAGIVHDGPTLYVAGQGPVDPRTGDFVLCSFDDQLTLSLENLRTVVEAAGAGLEGALKVTIYLRDMANYPRMNELYAQFFPKPYPARTTIQSDLPGFEVEIDAIVAVDGD
jgi:2-iminobutanoate/2-iminopropanoate deaminase